MSSVLRAEFICWEIWMVGGIALDHGCLSAVDNV